MTLGKAVERHRRHNTGDCHAFASLYLARARRLDTEKQRQNHGLAPLCFFDCACTPFGVILFSTQSGLAETRHCITANELGDIGL
jgi:hypothetical protein